METTMGTREDLLHESGQVMQDFLATAVFFQEAVARAAQLNSTDLQALGVLIREGPTTPGELAHQTGMTSGGAITLLVDRLERAGYAHRSRDDKDRRKVLVTANEDLVAKQLGPLYAPVGQQFAAYLDSLSTEQLHVCLDLLRRAVAINRDQLHKMTPTTDTAKPAPSTSS